MGCPPGIEPEFEAPQTSVIAVIPWAPYVELSLTLNERPYLSKHLYATTETLSSRTRRSKAHTQHLAKPSPPARRGKIAPLSLFLLPSPPSPTTNPE